ncbi:hypothetical protein Trydic_g7529 [Trypoxylus dichotomus]
MIECVVRDLCISIIKQVEIYGNSLNLLVISAAMISEYCLIEENSANELMPLDSPLNLFVCSNKFQQILYCISLPKTLHITSNHGNGKPH